MTRDTRNVITKRAAEAAMPVEGEDFELRSLIHIGGPKHGTTYEPGTVVHIDEVIEDGWQVDVTFPDGERAGFPLAWLYPKDEAARLGIPDTR